MKIEGPFDKILATSANMNRKTKPENKSGPNPAAPAKANGRSDAAAPGSASTHVDTYESVPTSSVSTARSQTVSAQDPAPVRIEKVERARQLVAEGAYDNQKVIDKIIDRLIETIREA